jgi:hypothetical protein
MTSGERRLAERLEAKLEDDYLVWFDVPIGPANAHPDFVILHPQRGILILEVKDWKLDTIQSIDRHSAAILTSRGLKQVANPLEQARQYAHAVANALERDSQLTFSSGRMQGKLLFPWAYGVVLPNISRTQFEGTDLGEVLDPHKVICQDEMLDAVEPEDFQKRLWGMFHVGGYGHMSLPQIDRVRWHMFPEIRIASQGGLFDTSGEEADPTPPDLIRVMDIQQEQLARSLGEGHRVIHGVAGSGKTLILGYRAEHLAQICNKPILILCYNRTLAKRLAQVMDAKGLSEIVTVHTFHQWCRAQLTSYNVGLPKKEDDDSAFFAEMVERLMRAVDRKLIPAGQYDAVLIDEGHDFEPHWLKLVVQMVDPASNSLLVLYDDAQSIYDHDKKRKFSFKSVGIQAQGRTTVLKINYRNTAEILNLASQFAKELLKGEAADEDGIPVVAPVSAGRHGKKPIVINLPSLKDEADYLADHLKEANRNGTPWRDMAVIYRHYDPVGKAVLNTLTVKGIPATFYKRASFRDDEDTVKVLTMHSCKGLEFPLVIIPGVGKLDGTEGLEPEEARLLYVAMTRATNELVVLGQ